MTLVDYRTLGRSGLPVSPLALGTMTFGAARWGSDEAGSRAVFDAYVEAGGNFIDTADVYAGGRSEEMLGAFIADRDLRHHLVVATKAGFSREQGSPLAGGNGAKNIHAALASSLRRLRTDHIDLFWIHVWDMVTPAEEVLGTLAGLVRTGKIRYFGLSNVPAWYVAKMATLAAAHAMPGPVALQFSYALTDRGIEAEHLPAAREFSLGMVPWSPLAGGFLTGKYTREDIAARSPPAPGAAPDGDRLNGPNPFGDSQFTDRNWRILEALRSVALEIGCSSAQAALAWAGAQPGISSLLLGASNPRQLADNIASLEISLTAGQLRRLDRASTPPQAPSSMFSPAIRRMVFGGAEVTGYNLKEHGSP